MYMQTAITLVFFTVTIQLCQGHSTYQAKMPNGDKVPNPCSLTTGATWPGVGHIAVAGMGARNVFGVAFKAANLTWTSELCQADTDGDGKTNGEELGDPQCTWTVGAQPAGNATGHPAICEPVTSADCKTKNSWLTSCDAAPTTAAPKTTTSSAVSNSVAFIIPFAVSVVMAAFC